MTAAVGSIQYMAPEVFMQNHCTIKSDVYSFAMVLWEMITREVPYSENPSPFAVCFPAFLQNTANFHLAL